MPDLGKQIVKQAFISKRRADVLLDTIQRDVRKLNKKMSKLAFQAYDLLVDSLDTDVSVIINSMDNLEKLSLWMPSMDMLLNRYRLEYKNIFEGHRVNLFVHLKDKELRLMKVLKKMDVHDDRVTITNESLDMMNAINSNMYQNIENMLVKWRGYIYDAFFQGITQSFSIDKLRELFVNTTGTLRIGSSLEEISEMEASMAAVAEKTAFNRGQAKKNGYDYCWNANPMDPRTKAICMSATLAGVIPEGDMLAGYGFPPRFICRCEIVYTRSQWVELNQSINNELRSVRTRLIDELVEAPRQLASWYVAGRLIVPNDPVRAAGDKMYAEIEEKLNLARETEVPDFEIQ